MVRILIDKTQGNKRYRSGITLCKYCRHDLFPHGKMFDVSIDKDAIRMPNGQWKCGVCISEDLIKTTKLLNRKRNMTGISFSGSEEFFTGEYAPPDTCTYYAYPCTYCQKYFYLVQPKDKQAGGAKRTVQYRNPNTNEIKACENRSEGVCRDCI